MKCDESKTTILARLLYNVLIEGVCFCIISNINSSIRIKKWQSFCYSWNLGHRRMCKISDHDDWMVLNPIIRKFKPKKTPGKQLQLGKSPVELLRRWVKQSLLSGVKSPPRRWNYPKKVGLVSQHHENPMPPIPLEDKAGLIKGQWWFIFPLIRLEISWGRCCIGQGILGFSWPQLHASLFLDLLHKMRFKKWPKHILQQMLVFNGEKAPTKQIQA